MKLDKRWNATGAAWEQSSQARLLRELDADFPWKQWRQLAQPYSPYGAEDKRKNQQLLRLYAVQHIYGLPWEGLDQQVIKDPALRTFLRQPTDEQLAARARDLPAFAQRLAEHGVDRPFQEAIARQVALIEGGGQTPPADIHPVAPAAAIAPPPVTPPSAPVAPAPAAAAPVAPSAPTEDQPRPVPPVVLPQDDSEGPGWGRSGATPLPPAAKPRRRVRVWPLLLLIILGVLGYIYGPGLYRQAQPWLKERFPNAVFLAAEPLATPTLEPVQVVEHTPEPTAAPTARPNPYDASAEIDRNLLALSQNAAPAKLIDRAPEMKKKAAVTLDGLLDKDTMLRLLEIAGQHEIPVSFFPSGSQAAEAPDVVTAIVSAGYPVGNYTLRGEPHLEKLDGEALVRDFTSAQKILQQVTGTAPSQLKGNALEYTDQVLLAVGAAGIPEAVKATAYLTYHSFKSYEEALAWVNRLPAGAIITIKLSGAMDESEYEPKEVVEQPAIDKESNLEVAPEQVPQGTPNERLIQLFDWLLKAIDASNFAPETVAFRESNAGKLATLVKELRTTQPAVGYAFYGSLERAAEVDGVLQTLQSIGGKGTFFVDQKNLAASAEAIQRIHQAGHRVEILHTAVRNEDYFGAAGSVFNTRKALSQLLGEEPRLVLQSGGTVGDSLLEAASATGVLPVSQDLSFAREEAKAATTPEEVITAVYKTNLEGFQRGKVLGFRLGFFDQEDLLPRLLTALQGSRNVYQVTDIYEMATNQAYLYTYPLTQAQILPEVYDAIHPGQLAGGEQSLIDILRTRYIGNPGIRTSKQLPGFNAADRGRIDKIGKVKGATNVVFLSFDDWGTDVGVTKLLNVLKKHNVKATFFVRTQFVPYNPNLLRAIALDGHDIASHTNSHYPLSNDANRTWEFTELTEQQVSELRADILTSWEVLQSVVGDIRLDNGLPALSRNFRPPTMAVGRKGFETVFDLGFDYVVNGEYTSKDYDAKSVDALLAAMERGIRSGSVVVMHFSDNVIYTADALDKYFTLIETGQRKAYSFARLSDYLKPLHYVAKLPDAPASTVVPAAKPAP